MSPRADRFCFQTQAVNIRGQHTHSPSAHKKQNHLGRASQPILESRKVDKKCKIYVIQPRTFRKQASAKKYQKIDSRESQNKGTNEESQMSLKPGR